MGGFPELRLSPGPSQNLWLATHNHAFQSWDRLLQLIEPHRPDLVDDGDRPLSWEECSELRAYG